MNNEFRIEADWLEGSQEEPIERFTFAQIAIYSGDQSLTELEDLFSRSLRPGVRASAYDLAYWFAENWWRIRWEPEFKTIDWRLSHMMTAVGGGYIWPNISFASDGVHVLIETRKTKGGKESPIRFICDVDYQIRADMFEAELDEFIQRVLARISSTAVKQTDLNSLWQELIRERHDENISAHRRLEALLGYDPDEAPGDLITSLQAKTGEVGRSAVSEIAAAERERSSQTLGEVFERAKTSDVSIRVESASDVLRHFSEQSDPSEIPWMRAQLAARLARDAWGIRNGPVSNDVLSDVLSVPKNFLDYTPSNGLRVAAGLRTHDSLDSINILMRAKVPTGRRFEIMRLVADHIEAPSDDRLLPATAAKTDRQKFQRAFAQEFLLPFDELFEVLGKPEPNDENISDYDIEDVAEKYAVSPLMVRTILVNQGILPRELLTLTS